MWRVTANGLGGTTDVDGKILGKKKPWFLAAAAWIRMRETWLLGWRLGLSEVGDLEWLSLLLWCVVGSVLSQSLSALRQINNA
jgi:hypothetical protein